MAVLDFTGGRFDGRKPVSGASGQQTIAPSASTGLTLPAAGARFAVLSPRTQAISLTLGGVTPTASVGMHVNVGDTVLLGPGQLSAVRMIQEAASASVDVEYFA